MVGILRRVGLVPGHDSIMLEVLLGVLTLLQPCIVLLPIVTLRVLHPLALLLALRACVDTFRASDIEAAGRRRLSHKLELRKVFANKNSLIPVETVLTKAVRTPSASENKTSGVSSVLPAVGTIVL